MNTVFNRTLLIDGSFMLHRALSVPNNFDLATSYGKKTGGIYGVLRSIFNEISDFNYFPIVVFDGGLSPRRLAAYPNYKRNEEKQLLLECKESEKSEQQILDEAFMREYRTQRKDIIEILHYVGIPCIRIENVEGDDLLYMLSRMSKDSIIVSDDKDLIQTVHEDENRRCRIWRTMHGEMCDINTLKDKWGNVEEFVKEKAIVGDPSDNIPSACFGVGEKTANGLLKLIENCRNEAVQFPRDEEYLAKVCKDYDIPKRKAYINYDNNQFNINMELIDLNLIDNEFTDDFIDTLQYDVKSWAEKSDADLLENRVAELEMRSLSTESMIRRVSELNKYLDIKDIDIVNNDEEKVVHGLF